MKNPGIPALLLALAVCGGAKAGVLLNLVNPPATSGTPYSLTFMAGASTTDIAFAGYQSPARLWAEDISLTNGGGNLLGQTWTFTPFIAADTADAGQFNDGYGTGTNGLHFENGTGDLDRFDQMVNTIPGQTYTLDFLFINSPQNSPSELVVSANAVPEPSSLPLLMIGVLAGLAFRLRTKARDSIVRTN